MDYLGHPPAKKVTHANHDQVKLPHERGVWRESHVFHRLRYRIHQIPQLACRRCIILENYELVVH